MTDRAFFDDWVGNDVTLTDDTGASTWRLQEKIGDKNYQPTAYEYNEDEFSRGEAGGAHGTFVCCNVDHPHVVAVLKVLMQVCYEGSEYTTPAEKTRQATHILPEPSEEEVLPLKILTQNACTSTPLLLHDQTTTQGDNGSVPGGFLRYLLMDKAAGRQLTSDFFWGRSRAQRDEIRAAFRVAFEECLRAGVTPFQMDLRHLFWDDNRGKITIAGFRKSQAVQAGDRWRDVEWIGWKLADCPSTYDWYDEKDPHPDTSFWTM